jgi:abhydrolase domain-containing protein 6
LSPFLLLSLVFALALLATTAWYLWRRGEYQPGALVRFAVRKMDVRDLNIRYHQSGRGPHLVLIHGLGANLYCWRLLAPLLAKDFTVTALDLPGFGESSKPGDATYGLDEQAERLDWFLAGLGIHKCYLVGNSMGGNIALWYARSHPTKALGVAVIAPATSPRLVPLTFRKWLWAAKPVSLVLNRYYMRWAHGRTVSKKHLVTQDLIEETFRTYGGQSLAVRSFMLATEAIRDVRLPHALAEMQTRTLILWGSKDRIVNRKIIEDLEAALPEAESHVNIGGGHHLQEDEPDWVAEKLLSFFRQTQD